MAEVLLRTTSAIMIPMGLTLHVARIPAALAACIAAVLLLVHHILVAVVIQGTSAHLLTVVIAALLLHWMEHLVLIHQVPARSVRPATDSSSLIMWIPLNHFQWDPALAGLVILNVNVI